ncbi:MAG: alpha/beta fold hydrolase [Halobacteriales archaeon]
MPEVDREGVSLAYETGGPVDGDPVVLIEGLGYSRWMWRWQRESLEGRYRTVLPDNRGTGESDAPPGPYSMDQFTADLDAVLADAGVEAGHLVGASLGGMIAQQYALEYDRAASLVLLCTTHGGESAVPIPPDIQDQILNVPADLDERQSIKYKMRPAMTDEFWEENLDLIERIVDWRLETDAPERARQAQAAAVQGFDVADRIGELSLPVLVMHGTADRVVPIENARRLHERFDRSELELFEGGPHLFFIEQADRVDERIRRFLDSHATG